MDITNVAQLITTVGFPIVACGALFWYIQKRDIRYTESMDKQTEAINNNTIAMTKLAERLDCKE